MVWHTKCVIQQSFGSQLGRLYRYIQPTTTQYFFMACEAKIWESRFVTAVQRRIPLFFLALFGVGPMKYCFWRPLVKKKPALCLELHEFLAELLSKCDRRLTYCTDVEQRVRTYWWGMKVDQCSYMKLFKTGAHFFKKIDIRRQEGAKKGK